MNLVDWWSILKEAKSPKAIEHKRRYETEYESSPSRKKYRRDLERERRKRGVAGKGGKDMSHTKTGKIVPEDHKQGALSSVRRFNTQDGGHQSTTNESA